MTANKEKLDVEEQIDRYVQGRLSSEEIEDLWVQLVQHQEYMDYLDTAANLKEVSRAEEVHAGNSQRGWIYAAAAAIVFLLVALAALQFGYFNAPEPLKPVQTIELDYYRSADAVTTLSDKNRIIRKAIELYNKGQFEEAVTLLNTERDKASNIHWIAELDITLGTFYYNSDKFNEAAFYFSDVVDRQSGVKKLTLEKAYWYLGNSYFQMSMMDKAEIAMQKAYKLNGAYSRVAKSYLDAMAAARAKQNS